MPTTSPSPTPSPPRKSFPLELSLLHSLQEMLGHYVWSEVLFQHAIRYQSWIFKKWNSTPVPEKAAQVMIFAAFIWLEEKNNVDQLLGCYKELPLDWLLLIVVGNWFAFPIFSFCFTGVLGLSAFKSFLLSKHTHLIIGTLLCRCHLGKSQEGQREGELGYFSPSFPPSQVSFLVTALSTPWFQPWREPLQLQMILGDLGLWVPVTLTLPFVPPALGACGFLLLLNLWLTLASPVHLLRFYCIRITSFLNEILFM